MGAASSREAGSGRRVLRGLPSGAGGRARRPGLRGWAAWLLLPLALGGAAPPAAAAGPAQARSQSLAERDLRRTVTSLVTALRIAEGCRI
ncbi:hypothetical protein, partial [Caldovatus aquaticus]